MEDKDNIDLNTSNIFEDFDVDNKVDNKIEGDIVIKDSIYYFSIIAGFFKYINYILIFILLILGTYVYIQKTNSDFFKQKDYLNPICNILQGKTSIGGNCSGLNNYEKLLNNNIDDIKIKIFPKIVDVLKKSYSVNSINSSKQALFVIDKVKHKNKVIKILEDFDNLKNIFTGEKKSRIVCENVIISGNILEANCQAFSASWETNIPNIKGDFIGDNIEGTSITLASSFIEYLANSKDFAVIERQKQFSKKAFLGQQYIFVTDFKIKLKYIGDTNLINNL